jgi:hypothetical protein
MRASVFNNPMLGAGLSELVRAYVGDPEKELRQQGMILDNQMAQIKLDQARNMGLGGMVARSMGGGSGGGGNAGGGTPPDLPERKLTESEKTRASRYVRDAGYEGADAASIQTAILDAFMGDPALTSLDDAASQILPGVTRTQDVVDPNEFIGTDRSWWDLLGSNGSWNFDGLGDMFRGPVMGPERLVIPSITPPPAVGQPVAIPDAALRLDQARDAIRRGANPEAVKAELLKMGIDPSGL